MRSSWLLTASFIGLWPFNALAQTTNAEACAKYEQVLQFQETLETHMQLATCYEKIGKLASAWAQLEHVVRVGSRPGSKEAHVARAREKMATLEARMPKLEIVVPPEVAGLAGVKITCNGSPLVPASWGKPIPVDMGEHDVEVRAKGRIPWMGSVKVDIEGQTISIDVGVPQSFGGAPDENTVKRPSAARIAGVVGIGLGVLGVGAGATLFGVAHSKNTQSKNGHCDAHNVCDNIGKPLQIEAIAYGRASTAAFVLGGALLGTGVILVAASSSDKTRAKGTQASLWIGPGSFYVRAVW